MRTALALAASLIALGGAAQARDFRILYATGPGQPAAAQPDGTGQILVPLRSGGANKRGAIVRLDGRHKTTTLYEFGADGPGYPSSPLLQDENGVLYGIASAGSNTHPGTLVYKLDHGQETTLHFFDDGGGGWNTPLLVRDAQGNLYGTSSAGGQHGMGYVFKIAADGTTSVLHDFRGLDGRWPNGGVVLGADGSLTGTAFMGGIYDTGTIWRIAADGTFKTLHAFKIAEGCQIWGGLTPDGKGDYYGVANYCGAAYSGTVFKFNGASGKVSLVHAFDGRNQGPERPFGMLLRDAKTGALFGLTEAGGAESSGTVFKLSPKGKLTALHAFSYDGDDGKDPGAALSMDAEGNLYGTTYTRGVVFEIKR